MEWIGPTWVEVDLDAIGNNLTTLRALTKAHICPVVKADAYGHGLTVTGLSSNSRASGSSL